MSAFKVLQFNMQFGQSWEDDCPDRAPVDLNLTVAEVRRHDADIILLQEVEQARPGGVQPEPPPNYTHLRAALDGYDSVFFYPKADARELPFGIGLAIFSRTALRDPLWCNLPSPSLEFEFRGKETTPTDRLLIGAKTTLQGRDLRIFNTHLLPFFMFRPRGEYYLGQRQLVIERLLASPGPALLGGDFNVPEHEALLQQFADAGYRSVQAEQVTWRRRPYVLDHIFYDSNLRAVRHEVTPTAASDHHVLVAEFEFAKLASFTPRKRARDEGNPRDAALRMSADQVSCLAPDLH